jgi:hypothetical protein
MTATMTAPSDRNERATTKPVHIPTVLAIGCSDILLARCWDCLAGTGVLVRDCEPALAATLAATRHPLAIVVARATYDLDRDELDALARDVRAALLPVDERVSDRELHDALVGAVRSSMHRRERRTSTGRYSILPGEMFVAPTQATPSEPPPTSAVRATSLAPDAYEDLPAVR